ncbi:hypothetical protein D3C72_1876700 [compost metagenome]
MIVHLPRVALLARVVAIGAVQDAKPRALFVVHKMLPAVGPDAVVPLPVALIARAHSQHGSRGHAFGLHPVVFAVVADAAVGRHAVVQAAVVGIPAAFYGGIEQALCAGQVPVGGQQGIKLQQQLGPFGLVADLVAPGAEDVAAVVAVVVPVHRPVGMEVLPHPALGRRGRCGI